LKVRTPKDNLYGKFDSFISKLYFANTFEGSRQSDRFVYTDGYPPGRMFRTDIYMIISHQNM